MPNYFHEVPLPVKAPVRTLGPMSLPTRAPGHAFTLIEVLIVMSVIAILVTILIPVVNLMRNQAKKTGAARMVGELAMAFDDYRDSDPRHLYPAPNPARQDPITQGYFLDRDPAAAISLFIEVENQQTLSAQTAAATGHAPAGRGWQTPAVDRNGSAATYGLLLDPWGKPYRYWLDGAYLTPAHVLDGHLMNGVADRPPGVDAAFAGAGTAIDWNPGVTEPAVYLWSSGIPRGGLEDQPANATNWIYNRAGQ
jgi:prepilin-type N-terminal cleavage/methylation domain-containing protein